MLSIIWKPYRICNQGKTVWILLRLNNLKTIQFESAPEFRYPTPLLLLVTLELYLSNNVSIIYFLQSSNKSPPLNDRDLHQTFELWLVLNWNEIQISIHHYLHGTLSFIIKGALVWYLIRVLSFFFLVSNFSDIWLYYRTCVKIKYSWSSFSLLKINYCWM